jgi:hypothetical protein
MRQPLRMFSLHNGPLHPARDGRTDVAVVTLRCIFLPGSHHASGSRSSAKDLYLQEIYTHVRSPCGLWLDFVRGGPHDRGCSYTSAPGTSTIPGALLPRCGPEVIWVAK